MKKLDIIFLAIGVAGVIAFTASTVPAERKAEPVEIKLRCAELTDQHREMLTQLEDQLTFQMNEYSDRCNPYLLPTDRK